MKLPCLVFYSFFVLIVLTRWCVGSRRSWGSWMPSPHSWQRRRGWSPSTRQHSHPSPLLSLRSRSQSLRAHKRSDTWIIKLSKAEQISNYMIKHFFLKKNENKPDNGEEGPRDKEAEREQKNHNQLIFLFLGTAAFHFLFLSHAFVFLGTHFHFIYCDFLLLVLPTWLWRKATCIAISCPPSLWTCPSKCWICSMSFVCLS